MTVGFVSEIFCSDQGEGPLVGQRQVFLRTAGCSVTCRWCDTVYSKVRSARCVVHGQNGGEPRTMANPVFAEAAAEAVLDAARADGSAEVVSITGGEPLEQAEFVGEVAGLCRGGGLGVYLETNGLHDEEIADIVPHVDVVAMDIKLPSATGVAAWKRHEAFLSRLVAQRRAREGDGGGPELFVKVVVDDRANEREIETAAKLVASADKRIPFILQPESRTLMSRQTTPEAVRRLRRLLITGGDAAAAVLEHVRVMPQVHKVLGIR